MDTGRPAEIGRTIFVQREELKSGRADDELVPAIITNVLDNGQVEACVFDSKQTSPYYKVFDYNTTSKEKTWMWGRKFRSE